MAKEITRTVTSYRHTIGELVRNEKGEFTVGESVTVDLPDKMGPRMVKDYLKAQGLSSTFQLIAVEKVEEKYAMTIEKFIANATKL